MKRAGRYIKRLLLALVTFVLLLTVAVAIASRTKRVQDLLRARTVTFLNDSYTGRFTVGDIDLSLLSGVTIHDVAVRQGTTVVLSVSRLSAGYAILPLLHGRIEVGTIEIGKLSTRLERLPNGKWSLLEALVARHPSPPSTQPSTIRLSINRINLDDAEVEVTEGGKTYRVDHASILANARVSGPNVDATVERIYLELAAPQAPPLTIEGSAGFKSIGVVQSLSIP